MHCDVFGGINMTMSSFRFLTLSFTIIFWKGLEEFRITFTGKWQTSIFTAEESFLLLVVYRSFVKKKCSVVVFRTRFIHKNLFAQFLSAHFLFLEI